MYVYEFLWRGRPSGENAYHVILAESSTDAFGNIQHVESSVLTPEQAEALGFPLKEIIKGINTTTLTAFNRVVAEKAAIEAERDALLMEVREHRAKPGG